MKKLFNANRILFVLEIRKKASVAEIMFYPAYSEPDMWGDTTPSAPLKNTNPYETMREAIKVLKEALFETNYRVYLISISDNNRARIKLYYRYLQTLEKNFDIQIVNNSIIYLFRR